MLVAAADGVCVAAGLVPVVGAVLVATVVVNEVVVGAGLVVMGVVPATTKGNGDVREFIQRGDKKALP